MPISATDLNKAYLAYFGRPADFTGKTYFATLEQADVIAAFDASPESQTLYGTDIAAKVNAIYNNLFNRDAEPAGLVYWVTEIQQGRVTPAGAAIAILNGALGTDATSVANKLAASEAFVAGIDTTSEILGYNGAAAAGSAREWLKGVGESASSLTAAIAGVDAAVLAATSAGAQGGPAPNAITLSNGVDILTGTAGNDTFFGNVGQNSQGAISNALATGDRIDGGAGVDAIRVSMINDNEVGDDNGSAPRPVTVNVEQIYVEALETMTLDATRMEGVNQFWSDFSRGDLTVTGINLRGPELNITKDVTFGLRDTRDGTDFNGLFDSLSLIRAAATSSNSQVLVRIADVSTETPATPLANVSVNLGFTLGTESVSLADVRSTDGTYAGLVTAIEAALVGAGRPGLVVTLSTPYTTVTFAGNTVTLPFTAQEVLITDPAGKAFSAVTFTQSAIAPVAGGFLVAGNATPVDPASTSNLIESNLLLDNAGNGSLAGDVVIGGMSNSQKGVEQFNVTVDRSSRIESLETTADKLQNIDIGSTGRNGDLWIGGTQASLRLIDANDFNGANLSLGQGSATFGGGSDAIQNLTFLSAANTAANVTLVADYNGNGRPSNAQSFVVATGSGDDVITASLQGRSTSTSTLTTLSVSATGGNNTITLSSSTADAFDNKATVTTGAGNDVITGGATSLTATAGGGNDVIYAENTGDKTVATLVAGVWSTAANAAPGGAAGVVVDASQLLFGRKVQVTLGLPGMNPSNSFVEGLEATADIAASKGFLTTERDLYQAAADAINNDAVMNKLATATVNSLGNLVVTYKIDGVTVAADDLVQIEVLGAWSDLSSGAQTSILNALKLEYQDSTITLANAGSAYNDAAASDAFAEVTFVGTESTDNGGTNEVNGGAGNDVIVLSSDNTVTATVDTVVFEGLFGNDTIVHFTPGAVAGGDLLDFTAYLTGKLSLSGSVESQTVIPTTLAAGADLAANSVKVITGVAFTTAESFAGLTGANLLAAINSTNTGAADWGNIGNGTLDALDGFYTSAAGATNLVGGVGKAIVMIENNLNAGEYKVFELAFNGLATGATAADFTSVTLIGSVDFGETVALDVANLV
jgi:hypothetical protein